MKKLCFIFTALLISTFAYSQNLLMGPKAKNAAVRKTISPKIKVVHDSAPSTLQGPIAKNTELWMDKSSKKLKIGFRDKIDNPKGLQAKNSKPWERKIEVPDSKAVYEEPKSMKPKKNWIH
jgi:hypothetical protein